MHIFLTGERGAGKSLAVRRAAVLLHRPCFGFVTCFREENHRASGLYLLPAAEPDLTDEAHLAAEWRDGRLTPLPGRFDTLGAALLREARMHPDGLILMDECGHLEKNAAVFQREILRCLDGDIPVLGALRKGQNWHGFIRKHPKVKIITVTPENRDALPAAIVEALGRTT